VSLWKYRPGRLPAALVVRRYVVALLCALLAFCRPGLATEGNEPAADLPLRHRSASALVHYLPGDEALAQRIAEILDYAEEAIGARYGTVPGHVDVYIYESNEAMAAGVKRTLGYSADEAAAVVHVGITQVENATLNLHRRLVNWGDRLWHAGVDEYVQGVTVSRFGMTPARTATWLDEGLSSYLAYQALKERLPTFESQFVDSTKKAAFRELVVGRLPRLAEISDRTRWFANINSGYVTWRNEYAKADVSVSYIIDHYGLGTLLKMLGDVRDGLGYEAAIFRRLGLSPEELESDIHRALFLAGVFRLYGPCTASLVIGLMLLVVVALRWRGPARDTSFGRGAASHSNGNERS
jgi:hypothetical protein